MSDSENMQISETATEDQPQQGESAGSEAAGKHVRDLLREKQALDSSEFPNALRLIDEEVNKEVALVQAGGRPAFRESKYLNIYRDKPVKLVARVLIPVKEHPHFNFIGKLLGPKGESMRKLQEQTNTKMSIRGRGSMRDKKKEQELRDSLDPKYAHLSDDLHVEIIAFASPAEAYASIALALVEVRKYLVPDAFDEIRQEQLREMQLIHGKNIGENSNIHQEIDRNVTTQRDMLSTIPGSSGSSVSAMARTPMQGRFMPSAMSRAPLLKKSVPGGVISVPSQSGFPRTQAPNIKKVLIRPTQPLSSQMSPAMSKVMSIFDRSRAVPSDSYNMEETIYVDAAGNPVEYIEYDSQEVSGTYLNTPESFSNNENRWGGLRTPSAGGVSMDRTRFRPAPYPRMANLQDSISEETLPGDDYDELR